MLSLVLENALIHHVEEVTDIVENQMGETLFQTCGETHVLTTVWSQERIVRHTSVMLGICELYILLLPQKPTKSTFNVQFVRFSLPAQCKHQYTHAQKLL